MYTILSITIIIALAMACCFLYVKNRELKQENKMLGKANEALSKSKSRSSILGSLSIQPDCYEVYQCDLGCLVAAVWEKEDLHVVVKTYHAKDDESYARRCAEELLDKLNENY